MVEVGAQVPRRGNALSRLAGHLFIRLLGWRITGAIPDIPRMVMIGAPHTSNMDGVLALGTLTALGLRASTMIKDTAFKGFMGVLLRWFGAIPINRRSPKGIVEQSIDTFSAPQMILLIAAEGTRHSARELKRGYYHIAQGAGVPIMLASVDYKKKIVNFGLLLQPTGDYEADLKKLLAYYRDHSVPRHPERLSKPMAEIMGVAWNGKEKTKP